MNELRKPSRSSLEKLHYTCFLLKLVVPANTTALGLFRQRDPIYRSVHQSVYDLPQIVYAYTIER